MGLSLSPCLTVGDIKLCGVTCLSSPVISLSMGPVMSHGSLCHTDDTVSVWSGHQAPLALTSHM